MSNDQNHDPLLDDIVCPECGSANLEYGEYSSVQKMIENGIEYVCLDCGAKFSER